jgi:hypothetical protein
MNGALIRRASLTAILLGFGLTAEASNPVKWQISVGPEAVLTARGGGRLPFSPTSNPCPALRPTELFPADPPADRGTYVLRGKIRVYFAVLGFAEGGRGVKETVHEVTLGELTLDRVVDDGVTCWRIPDAAYAELLKQLAKSGVAGRPEE